MLEKLLNGQRIKISICTNNLIIKNKENSYKSESGGELGRYDSDYSKGSLAEDYF